MQFDIEFFISLGMLIDLFSGVLRKLIAPFSEKEIYEIRLRLNRPVTVLTVNGQAKLKLDSGALYMAKQSDFDRILGVASNYSVYSVMEELVNGFLKYEGGIRIGATGEGVCEKGKLISIKNFSGLIVRVPHEVIGCGEEIKKIIKSEGINNLLVVSPPNCGKTTVLRDLARLFSYEAQTLIIDERGELAALMNGEPTLDVGECDVIANVPKYIAYENCIRSASPELIVTDEVFKESEINSLIDITRCGVRVFASLHAQGVQSLKSNNNFKELLKRFDGVAVLTSKPSMGTLKHFEKVKND